MFGSNQVKQEIEISQEVAESLLQQEPHALTKKWERTTVTTNAVKKSKKKRSVSSSDEINLTAEWDDAIESGEQGMWAATVDKLGVGITYKWSGAHWQEVSQAKGRSLVAKWVSDEFPAKRSSQAAKSAFEFVEMRLCEDSPLPTRDEERIIIPLLDKYLEILDDGTIAVLEPDPTLGMTYVIGVSLGHDNPTHTPKPLKKGLLNQFLTSSLPDADVRALVQEQCAMSLIPGRKSECAYWFGDGENGKGELAETTRLMHPNNANVELDKLGKEFHLEACYGSSLIICDEVNTGKFNEGAFKTFITGNGQRMARKGVKNLANWHNEAYVICMANQAPFFQDASHGVARRIVPVHWPSRVSEEQKVKNIGKKIFKQEPHLFLDWMLEGALRIVKRGGKLMPEHERPKCVQDLKLEIILNNDVIKAWVHAEGVAENKYCSHTKTEVYEAYQAWALKDGKHVLEPAAFWRKLWANESFRYAKASEFQTTVKGMSRVRCVRIALNRDENDLYDSERMGKALDQADDIDISF